MILTANDIKEILDRIENTRKLYCEDCPVNCEAFDTKSQCEKERKKLMQIFKKCKSADIASKELFIGDESIGFEICCKNRKTNEQL